MLYGPDGQYLPDRQIPLTVAAIRALGGDDDAEFLLRHGSAVLPAVQLELVCLTCVVRHVCPIVRLSPGEHSVQFRCGHTAGVVRLDKGRLSHSKLLDELRWNFRCTACEGQAVADNAKADATFQVACPCQTRVLANPLQAAPGPAAG